MVDVAKVNMFGFSMGTFRWDGKYDIAACLYVLVWFFVLKIGFWCSICEKILCITAFGSIFAGRMTGGD